MLSRDQIDFYQTNGYIIVERLFSTAELEMLRVEVDATVERSASVSENDDVYDLEASHTPEYPRVRRIKKPHAFMDSALAIGRHQKLVAVLRDLIGPGIRLQNSKLNMKSAGYGAAVEWHQDWAFYPHTNQDLLAAGVLLDDCDEENGPLLVIPGSHRGPVYDHHSDGYFCGAIDPQACDVDFDTAVPLTGPAGSVTFHHVRALHGSETNRSDRTRRLLLYQYTAVDAWPLVEPVSDLKSYDERIIAGEPTLAPRLEDVPVRMPLPPATFQGSIYENQRASNRRYFERREEEAQGAAV